MWKKRPKRQIDNNVYIREKRKKNGKQAHRVGIMAPLKHGNVNHFANRVFANPCKIAYPLMVEFNHSIPHCYYWLPINSLVNTIMRFIIV